VLFIAVTRRLFANKQFLRLRNDDYNECSHTNDEKRNNKLDGDINTKNFIKTFLKRLSGRSKQLQLELKAFYQT